MNPYIWLTRNSSWTSGASDSDVQVESGMEVTNYVLDQGDVSVWTENKHTITYTVDGTTGKFYLPDGGRITDSHGMSNFLNSLLGSNKGFTDSDGNEFTVDTPVYSDISITANKYKLALRYYSGDVEYYYFNAGESFRSRYGSMPESDYPAESGYKSAWKYYNLDTIVDADTVINSELPFEACQTPM